MIDGAIHLLSYDVLVELSLVIIAVEIVVINVYNNK